MITYTNLIDKLVVFLYNKNKINKTERNKIKINKTNQKSQKGKAVTQNEKEIGRSNLNRSYECKYTCYRRYGSRGSGIKG